MMSKKAMGERLVQAFEERQRLRATCLKAGEAIKALQNALMRWGDNGLQIAHARRFGHAALHEILRILDGKAGDERDVRTGVAQSSIQGDPGRLEELADVDEDHRDA